MARLKLLIATIMGLTAQVTIAGSAGGQNGSIMDTVERAQKEVKNCLSEMEVSKGDKCKLESGLKEVQSDSRVLDIHLGTHES